MTTKSQHATALAEHYVRATSPGSHRQETLEAVAAILGDDTPEEWTAHLESARDLEARRAARAAELEDPTAAAAPEEIQP